MDLKEQLKLLVETVKKNNPALLQEAMAARLGYTRTYLSELLGKRGKVEEYHINDFKREFRDELENTTSASSSERFLAKRRVQKLTTEPEIPVFIGNTRAGTIEVYSDDPEMQKPIGHLPANVFPGCNHAEKVNGESMYPLIVNQAYVIGKIVDKRGFIYGEKYGIHTKYGQSMVKYIHPSDQGKDHIKIVSHSKQVPPQDIPLDDITFAFRVYFIVNPS